MQYKAITHSIQIKDGSAGRRIFGYASTYGPPKDSVGDIVDPGAFDKTIKKALPKKRIKLFLMHRTPIGLIDVLESDKKGLYYEGVASNTQEANDALELAKDSVLDKSSIGYRPRKELWNEEEEANHLIELQLFEISLVPFPANENADVLGVKSLFPGITPEKIASSLIASLGLKFDADRGVFLRAPEHKGAVTFQDFPLTERARDWGSKEAETRVRDWASAADAPNPRYRRAFSWVDAENEDNFSAYKMPIADVINGELFVIPKAVFAAAEAIDKTKGISTDDKKAVQNMLGKYYAKMRKEFDDESLVAPWDKKTDDINIETKDGIENALGTIVTRLESIEEKLAGKPEPPPPAPDGKPEGEGKTKEPDNDNNAADEAGLAALIEKAKTINVQLSN